MLLLSPPFLAAVVAFALALWLLRRFSSPLRKMPGPAHSLFTSAVLRWHELRGLRTSYIHGLHLRYGPAVRIAPDEASFASAAAVREIYCSGGSGYEKSEFYDMFQIYGRR